MDFFAFASQNARSEFPTPAAHNVERARVYVRRIKNALKRSYAEAWLEHVLTTSDDVYGPERPSGLSFMGGQAVRISIGEILRGM